MNSQAWLRPQSTFESEILYQLNNKSLFMSDVELMSSDIRGYC